MTNPHQPMRYPIDSQPVRPGTSDALTARTIDATIHPPLVRARESVTEFVPRVGQTLAPLASPLFLGTVVLTLTFLWIAKRMRYRPSALLLSALLVMTLTSFHPVADPLPSPDSNPEQLRVAQVRRPRTLTRGAREIPSYGNYPQPRPDYESQPTPDYESAPVVMEPPDPPDQPETPDDGWRGPDGFVLPRISIPRLPEVSEEMMRSAERMMRDNEQVQEMMEQIRIRLREEARHRRMRRHYGTIVLR